MATLLLVDDDRVVRETLCEVLRHNYECHTADRAEQALEYLEVENYDVVLTDISMPGLGGEEILRRVKQRDPTTPVIIITGTAGEEKEELLAAVWSFTFLSELLG